jgi:hypothetical protein
MIQEKKNHASGITHPSNHVIPNSFERLTSETAARHTQPAPPPAVGLNEENASELGKLFEDPQNP